jgi:uncharacterized protein YkwD
MKANGYFSHTNREGKSPFDRLADAGITYRTAAENILEGEASPTRVLQLWMQSPGHRMNIVECSFTHHGIGRVDTHWTHIFLRDPGSFDSSESTLSVGQADVDIGEAG